MKLTQLNTTNTTLPAIRFRSFTHRATLSAALLFAGGLSACGEMEENPSASADITESEALISASDLSSEDLDLQSFALNEEGESMGSACSPEQIQERGRRHHSRRQHPERSEDASTDEMEMAPEGQAASDAAPATPEGQAASEAAPATSEGQAASEAGGASPSKFKGQGGSSWSRRNRSA